MRVVIADNAAFSRRLTWIVMVGLPELIFFKGI